MKHSVAVAIDMQVVRRRAYDRWLERGRPAGNPDQDWLEAERELLAESARQGTQVVCSAQGGLAAVSDALQARGGRRAPRTLITRAGSAPAARLLAALVPEATRELRQAAILTGSDLKVHAPSMPRSRLASATDMPERRGSSESVANERDSMRSTYNVPSR